MKNFIHTSLPVFFMLLSLTGISQNSDTASCAFDCCRPDGHVPIGIMTDHVHGRSKWNAGYTFMSATMKGNQRGTSAVTSDEMLMNYQMSPSSMIMQMHMFMIGYGVTERFTLMGMFAYVNNRMSMDVSPATGTPMPGMQMNAASSASHSSGLADTKLYGLYDIWNKRSHRIILSAGAVLPTGSIAATGTTVPGAFRLPYGMQRGTGSFSLIPGITYTGQTPRISWGAAVSEDVKTGANAYSYQWGNEFRGSGWLAYKISDWVSLSGRTEHIYSTSIRGSDRYIAMAMYNDPTANPANYGGSHTNLLFGANFYVPKGPCKELRFGLEYLLPVYQNLNGTQMPLQSGLIAGVYYLFM